MVRFSALLSAVCVLTADSYRTAVKADAKAHEFALDESAWNFDGVRLGTDPNGPLIPNMVPPAGTTFEVQSRERLDFFESNEYRWAFVGIEQNGVTTPIQQWFATLQGGFFGNLFGARRTEITNNQGVPIFVIEMAKYIWNPTRLHWSFRIRHPITEEILFTINKDWFGAGFLFMRDEWRIYRGRQREGNQIYHIVGGYFGYSHRFYHEKREWRRGMDPAAEASQSVGRSLIGLPDVFSLKVHEGEDTALLLAATVIIDMVHESEAAARAREAASNSASTSGQNSGGHSLLEAGSMESVWSEEAMAAAEGDRWTADRNPSTLALSEADNCDPDKVAAGHRRRRRVACADESRRRYVVGGDY